MSELDYYLTYDDPIPYKDLKIYPATMREYLDFHTYATCLLYEKNSIPNPRFISMSYLRYIFYLAEEENSLALHLLYMLLKLVLHIKDDESIKFYKRKECIELADARGKGEEEYLRFELDDFRNINSIKPMEIGIRTHWYTTFYLLNNATNIHELKFKSNFEMNVYRKLEKIAKEMKVAIKMKTDGYEINGKLVVIDEESVKIDNENYDFEKLKSDIF